MTATITATMVPAAPLPFIQVDIEADTAATVVSWQIRRQGGIETVTLNHGTTFSGAFSFEDHTAPLGVPIVYTFTVRRSSGAVETGQSAPVTITGTAGCWLTDPYTGTSIRINLVSWPTRNRAPRRAVHGVLDRPDPIALFDTHLWPDGVWEVHTVTDADLDAVTAILTTGLTRLRTQPGSAIVPCYASTGRIQERRMSGRGGDHRRFVAVEIQEIAPLPDTGETLPATLQGLHDLVPTTLTDLAALRPTLRQLSMIRT